MSIKPLSLNVFREKFNAALTAVEVTAEAFAAANQKSILAVDTTKKAAKESRITKDHPAVRVLQSMFQNREECQINRGMIVAQWVIPNLTADERATIANDGPDSWDKSDAANAMRKARKAVQDKYSQYSGRIIDKAYPKDKGSVSDEVRALVLTLNNKLSAIAADKKATDFELQKAQDVALLMTLATKAPDPLPI